jgi:hypothetical protein
MGRLHVQPRVRSCFLYQVESYYDIHVITTRVKERTLLVKRSKCIRASVRNIFKLGEAFLLSFLVRAVEQLSKILLLAE